MRTNRSAPAVTVVPELVYPDVPAAVEWLAGAFGFVERIRIGEDHRSQMRVGEDGAVIIADTTGDRTAPTPGIETSAVKVRVEDVDALVERARAYGARILAEPREYPYGERECGIEDLAGHRWHFTQSVRDVDPAEWGGTLLDRPEGGGI